MTARSIALISPMRQRFAALTKASKFAAEIIEKYSGTEPFPFSGETLIYFNALRESIEQEQKHRGDTTYILKLVIIRKLMLEGKLGDPTVTKLFLNTVSGSIERSLHYLRISDNNAYIRTTEAISYINNAEDLSENILLSEVREGTQLYRYSAVDIKTLTNRFFGGNSESYAYSGVYSYSEPPVFVFRKEAVEGESAPVTAPETHSQTLSDNVVNEIIAGTPVDAESVNYSYSSENLTYKTENTEVSESSVTSVSNVQNAENVQNTVSVQNIENVRNTAEAKIFAPVTNITGSTTVDNGTVINAGDSNYSYNNENLTYKTENTEISESSVTSVSNVQNAENVQNTVSVQNIENVRNTAEAKIFAPVTNITDSTTEHPETVINAGDSNYSYNSENLTYKTENTEISESSAASVSNVQNAVDVQNIENVRNVANVRNTAETKISAPVTNITDSTTADNGTVINAGDSHYSYNNENLTYKTENTADKATQEAAPDRRADNTPTLAEALANIGSEDLRRVAELPEISLLVMNSFLSGGTGYLSEVKNRYIHKHISLAPAAAPVIGSAAERLLNSPAASFGAVSYAVSLLASEKELTPYERSIYDTAVTKVYTEKHSYSGFDTKQMFAGMDTRERTKVLSLIVKELESGTSAAANVQPSAAKADVPAPRTDAPASAEHRTIRSVMKKFVDSIIKPSGAEKPAAVQPAKSEDSLRTVSAPTAEKFTVTETEMTLLKLLSEDKSGSIARAVEAAERGKDTVSARLDVLYHGIAGGKSAEKTVAENVENAVYMPTVLNFYDAARLTSSEAAGNKSDTNIFTTDVRNTRIIRSTFADMRELPVYRTDIRNINNIQTTDLSQSADTVAEQDIYSPSVMQDIRKVNVTDVHADAAQNARTEAQRPAGAPKARSAGREVRENALTAAPVFRGGLYSGEIVRKALEKIEKYERVQAATDAHTTSRGTAFPAVKPAVGAVDPDTGGTAADTAEERGYADIMQSLTFNTAVNEYSLPVTLIPEGKVSESVRLLPVYTLDGVILPRKLPEIKTSAKKALNRLTAPKERTFAAPDRRMTITRGEKMLAKKAPESVEESVGLPVSTETYTVPMDRMMPDETILSYREPISASAPAPAVPAAAEVQPSTSDLVKQFGNLIEGGDAGLIPSFDVGTRGIGEAMAAIEQTAEKVAVNSKLIEEIREKQRTIETVTLKSSDMDAISEEMIRRLRSRMRLDRSRFAGQ